MALPSPIGDGVVEVMLVVVRCRCRVMLAMSLLRLLGRGAMYLSSRAARSESGSTTASVMCDRSQDVPTL
jgi:hypothetical protein